MELSEIGINSRQANILKSKKLVSVEAFLRKQPLHYWDFTKPYALDLDDKETMDKVNKGMPFCMSGICKNYQLSKKDDSKMSIIKLKVEDDKTKNMLFVNIIGMDAFRASILRDNPDSPLNKEIVLPEYINPIFSGSDLEVSPKCLKKIEKINEEDDPDVMDYIELKTFGMDEWSKKGLSVFNAMFGMKTVEFVKSIFNYNDSEYTQALRWYGRGLRLDLAIKKVMLDAPYLMPSLMTDKKIIVGGFISYDERYKCWSVLNPGMIKPFLMKNFGYTVQYSSMKGFPDNVYRQFVDEGIKSISSMDFIPGWVTKKAGLPDFKESASLMHHPKSYKDVVLAKKRAVFENLLYLATKIKVQNPENGFLEAPVMNQTEYADKYKENLSFSLTNDQEEAIKKISECMSQGRSINALIQGDVGTGKTAVAFILMLQAVSSGFQAAIAAPYTALAWQHYRDMKEACEFLGLNAVILISGQKTAERKKILQDIADGTANIIIGTHSVFGESVEYKNLGLVISDEEHKFGVIHQESFEDKAIEGCHRITMSATPIPKSLAATVYGDNVEVITIKDKPEGRLPIQTAVCRQDKTAADFIIKQVKTGRQAYIVCPSISSEDMASIEDKERIYKKFFDNKNVSMAVLTGKMKANEKEQIMQDFTNGKIDVLMATTVIEVGINVPNATVITITGAERFGFSTLHQLRGRVGRGKYQSYCILQTNDPNEKLEFMTTTNDGFLIAEKDLELRGPGSLFGERQSGDNFYISLMLAYPKMYEWIKPVAAKMCEDATGKDFIRRYEELFVSEEER